MALQGVGTFAWQNLGNEQTNKWVYAWGEGKAMQPVYGRVRQKEKARKTWSIGPFSRGKGGKAAGWKSVDYKRVAVCGPYIA